MARHAWQVEFVEVTKFAEFAELADLELVWQGVLGR